MKNRWTLYAMVLAFVVIGSTSPLYRSGANSIGLSAAGPVLVSTRWYVAPLYAAAVEDIQTDTEVLTNHLSRLVIPGLIGEVRLYHYVPFLSVSWVVLVGGSGSLNDCFFVTLNYKQRILWSWQQQDFPCNIFSF